MVESSTKKKLPQTSRPTGNVYWDPIGFCWSCGWKADKRHNSFTCNSPKPGHQKGTTRSNPMGEVIGTGIGMDEVKEGQ
eukprot:15161113-Ditylum_brightwellii.AAC.1